MEQLPAPVILCVRTVGFKHDRFVFHLYSQGSASAAGVLICQIEWCGHWDEQVDDPDHQGSQQGADDGNIHSADDELGQPDNRCTG